jgi:hypothetical protein
VISTPLRIKNQFSNLNSYARRLPRRSAKLAVTGRANWYCSGVDRSWALSRCGRRVLQARGWRARVSNQPVASNASLPPALPSHGSVGRHLKQSPPERTWAAGPHRRK